MSLTLEVKKFINSEHTGRYAEIDFPCTAASENKKRRHAAKPAQTVGAAAPEDASAEAGFEYDSPSYEAEAGESTTKIRVHYTEAGMGEPLILIHSVGQSYYTWHAVFDRLSEYYRVIALDLPGHGYSDRPAEFGYTIDEMADAIRLFMDETGIESAHIMAFSMGSAYALKLAADHPERVGRMILLAPGGVTSEMPTFVKLVDSALFGSIASALYGSGTVEKLLLSCFFDLTLVSPDMVNEYYRPASDPDGRRAIRTALHYYDDEALVAGMREIDLPVLMISGTEDKWRGGGQTELYHNALPQAGVSVVRNAGHLIHEEKPDRVIAGVLEFIPVIMPDAE